MGEVVLTQHWGSCRACFAVRVSSSVDLSTLAGFAELTTTDRYLRAHQEDVGYLTRLSESDVDCAFEARWLAHDGAATLTLLGRVDADTEERAREAGTRLLRRLADTPPHVRAEPITDEREIEQAFRPFEVAIGGIAEIRKPCLVARPQRPDAGVRMYLAVPPFKADPQRWPALLERLAASPDPVLLSTGLQPTTVSAEFGDMLTGVADQYGRLARPGEFRVGGLYSSPRQLDPEPFAVEAERLYRQAAARYLGRVFRMRVTVAAAGQLDDGLARAVADVLGPGTAVVERPSSIADDTVLRQSITALGVPRWGGHEVWQSPEVPDALRLLGELADPTEAGSAVCLPAAAGGGTPALPVRPPVEREPTAGSAGITFNNSDVHIAGSVFGGDQHNYRG